MVFSSKFLCMLILKLSLPKLIIQNSKGRQIMDIQLLLLHNRNNNYNSAFLIITL